MSTAKGKETGKVSENKKLILGFWEDLAQRDFDKIGSYFAADGHYEDVPAPDDGATGHAAVATRLRVGLEPIED